MYTHTPTLSSFNYFTTSPTSLSFTPFPLRPSSSSSSSSSSFSSSYSTPIIHTNSNLIDSISVENENEISHTNKHLLACPVCYRSFTFISLDAIPKSSLQCSTCQKTYVGNQTHLDLTTTGESKTYGEPMPASTELFRH
ncbi:hypothetical protein Lal_00020361 [Lupinus albus]|nr:hypothetical protein Lal_00020361 [Lupinus albus]